MKPEKQTLAFDNKKHPHEATYRRGVNNAIDQYDNFINENLPSVEDIQKLRLQVRQGEHPFYMSDEVDKAIDKLYRERLEVK